MLNHFLQLDKEEVKTMNDKSTLIDKKGAEINGRSAPIDNKDKPINERGMFKIDTSMLWGDSHNMNDLDFNYDYDSSSESNNFNSSISSFNSSGNLTLNVVNQDPVEWWMSDSSIRPTYVTPPWMHGIVFTLLLFIFIFGLISNTR